MSKSILEQKIKVLSAKLYRAARKETVDVPVLPTINKEIAELIRDEVDCWLDFIIPALQEDKGYCEKEKCYNDCIREINRRRKSGKEPRRAKFPRSFFREIGKLGGKATSENGHNPFEDTSYASEMGSQGGKTPRSK